MRNSRPRVIKLEDRLAPALVTWDGGALNNNNWTTPANWVGDAAPSPGDDLSFPGGVTKLNAVNDFPAGTTFNTLLISGLGYQISGNALSLTGGISATLPFANPAPDVQIFLPITLAGANVFSRLDGQGGADLLIAGTVNLNGNTLDLQPTSFPGFTFTATSSITGTGNVIQSGNGGTVYAGTNTFVGTTTITGGFLTVTGQTGAILLNSGGLSGTGTTGPITNSGGNVFPGVFFPTSGVLTTGSFQQTGGSMQFNIGPNTPLISQQLNVIGTVQLGGDVLFGVDNRVTFQPGDSFTIVNNDGTDPVVGAFANAPEGANVGFGQTIALRITYRGGDGNDVVVSAGFQPTSAVGAGAGGIPLVNVYNDAGQVYQSFLAYDQIFNGGVRVAVADVTGDNINDIITAPGFGGGPVIRVFDGTTFTLVREFLAYDPSFIGGVFVSAADMNDDGRADITTGAGAGGGPHVKLFDGLTGGELSSFFAYDASFRGGVSVAAHERSTFVVLGLPEFVVPGTIVTGAGPGGGPHVRVFNALTTQVQSEFFACDASFTGGVNVATGTLTNPGPGRFGLYSVITAPASNGGPVVRTFSTDGQLGREFLAYDPAFFGGVTLSTIRLGENFSPILLTGTGAGGAPLVNQFQPDDSGTLQLTRSVFAFDPAFTGGIYVG